MSTNISEHETEDTRNSGESIDLVALVTFLALLVGVLPGLLVAGYHLRSPEVAVALLMGAVTAFGSVRLFRNSIASRYQTWMPPSLLKCASSFSVGAVSATTAALLGGAIGFALAIIAVCSSMYWWAPWAVRCWVSSEIHAGVGTADQLNRVWPAFTVGRFASTARFLGWIWNGQIWCRNKASTNPSMPSRVYGSICQFHDLRPISLRFLHKIKAGIGTLGTSPTQKLGSSETEYLEAVPAQRSFITAGSGGGKSTLGTAAVGSALSEGVDSVVWECKNSPQDARELLNVGRAAGVPTFHWSEGGEGVPLNLLGGLTEGQVAQLLFTMTGQPDAASAGAGAVYSLALLTGCEALARAGVPDLATAIQWATKPPSRGELSILNDQVTERGGTIGDLVIKMLGPIARRLEGLESADGILITEQSGLVVISCDVSSPAGRAVLAAGIAQTRASISQRSTGKAKPRMLLVDEAAAAFPYIEDDLIALYAMGRSAQLYPWVSVQDVAQINDPNVTQQLLTNSDAVFVGRMANAGRLAILLGGSRWVNEATRPAGTSGISQGASVRPQISHTIAPVIIEQLPNWCWAVYASGQWRGVFCPPKHSW